MGRPVLSIASLDDLVVEGQLEERGADRRSIAVDAAGRRADRRDRRVRVRESRTRRCTAVCCGRADGAAASVPVATARSARCGFQLPVEGGAIGGDTVVVRGVAARPLGRVHIAAIVGYHGTRRLPMQS